MDLLLVDLGEGLDHYIAVWRLLFVVLLEQHSADQAHDGAEITPCS